MKASGIFSKSLEKILTSLCKPFGKYADLLRSNSKQIPASSASNLIPYGTSEYLTAVNEYVLLGKGSPDDAIDAVLELFPFSNKCPLYAILEAPISSNPKDPIYVKEFTQLMAAAYVADTVAQLLTFTKSYKGAALLSNILTFTTYSIQSPKPFEELLHGFLIKIIKQYSVILGILSIESYQQCISAFQTAMKVKKNDTVVIFTLFQYLRPGKKINDLIGYYVSLDSHYKFREFWKALRHVVHQIENDCPLTNTNQKALAEMVKSAMKKTNKPYATEISILLDIKTKGSADKVENLISSVKEIFDDPKLGWRTKLYCLLYSLQDGHIHEATTFWQFGENNGFYSLESETARIWQPTADPKKLSKFFEKYIPEFINVEQVYPIITQILLNLCARSLHTICDIIPTYINSIGKDSHVIPALLPVLSTFNQMLNQNENFQEAIKSAEDSKQRLRETLSVIKNPLLNLLSQSIPDQSNTAYPLRSLSIYECPPTLIPDFHPKSATDTDKMIYLLGKSEEKIQKFYKQIFPLSKPREKLKIQSNIGHSSSDQEKVIIHLICLLTQIATPSDLTSNPMSLLDHLIKCSIGSSAIISYFATYAIQFLFITNAASRNGAHEILIKYLKTMVYKPCSFTLLALLHQFLSLPFTPSFQNKQWTQWWLNNIQAMLLMQLTTPYIENRHLVYLIWTRFQEICEQNNNDITIYSEILTYQDTIASRLQTILGRKDFPVVQFEDMCTCCCAQLAALYFSEVMIIAAQEKYKSIIEVIIEANPLSELQMVNDDNKVHRFNYSILLSIFFRLQLLTSERINVLHDSYLYLKRGTYITEYRGLVPLSAESVSTPWKSDFLRKNTQELITLRSTGKSEWSQAFLQSFISNASPAAVAQMMQLMVAFMQMPVMQPDKKTTSYAVPLTIFDCLLSIAHSPDFQTILLAGRSAFQASNSALSLMTTIVTKDQIPQISTNPEIKELVSRFLKLAAALCRAMRPEKTTVHAISLRIPKLLNLSHEWSYNERIIVYDYIESIKTRVSDTTLQETCRETMSLLAGTPNLFISEEKFTENNREWIFVNSPDEDLVMALRLNPAIYDRFVRGALSSGSKTNRYATALFALYVDEIDKDPYAPSPNNDINIEIDQEQNTRAYNDQGRLTVLALLKLTSFDYKERLLSYRVLQRLLPIYSAMAQPDNMESIALLNTHLLENTAVYVSRSGILKPDGLSQICEKIFSKLPFLVNPVSDVLLEQIEHTKESYDMISLLTIFDQIAKHIKLQECGLNFLKRILNIHKQLDSSLVPMYCDIFVSFGMLIPENRTYLADTLFSFTNKTRNNAACEILVHLNLSQPVDYIYRTIQPLNFQSWFFNTIIYSADESSDDKDNENSNSNPVKSNPTNHVRLSLRILEELILIDISHVMTVIHSLIHYCLMYIDKPDNPDFDIISNIMEQISLKFIKNPEDGYNKNTKVSYNSGSSKFTDIRQLVSNLYSAIKQFLPPVASSWQRVALNWASACGDLELASKSVVILTELAGSDDPHVSIFMRSLVTVLKAKISPEMFQSVSNYSSKVLDYFYKVVCTNLRGKDGYPLQSSFYIAQFATPFIYNWQRDPISATSSIRILTEFARTPSFFGSQFDLRENLSGLCHLFNLPMATIQTFQFLSTYISIIPQSEHKLRMETLLNILPIIYGSFCAYHCFEPYSSGIPDDLINLALDAGQVLSNSFQGTNIAYIFNEYFSDPDNSSPEEFLEAISLEINHGDIDILEKVVPNWTVMAGSDNESIYTAIFAMSQSILVTAEENMRSKLVSTFEHLVLRALDKGTLRAMDFLFVVAKYNPGYNGDNSQNTLPVMKPHSKNIAEALSPILQILPANQRFSGTVNLNHSSVFLPMVLEGDLITMNLLNDSNKSRFLPYQDQIDHHNEIIKSKDSRQIAKPTLNDAQTLFLHTKIRIDGTEISKDDVKVEKTLPPEFFMVYDHEIPRFFERIDS
ncbi:hypothetical protein TVAG_063900 [Trichomonas vaginalis G3]|uniref:Uncharacterized protein n=1 Tax=Trichomonas vaginalis (strain ATCC PRA-98 / G3) TaxID=412133 RepID=A2FG91_TRIV3|nr:hypothetical protein TVAGG3_0310200 [Trichomonas vaginalis G3]EAX96087.1 hypothetical protein TVAG_063900 [Trichomonas vaginalis G3]KAI5528541.1 hypothetical protein TVAGG3_0310200 [Trichomonas vaginalis G3]|eukprot:XP_001309017.1 hypothetical protein [Trichomonas vaginalis G3]